jgi:hypothetical protein
MGIPQFANPWQPTFTVNPRDVHLSILQDRETAKASDEYHKDDPYDAAESMDEDIEFTETREQEV